MVKGAGGGGGGCRRVGGLERWGDERDEREMR